MKDASAHTFCASNSHSLRTLCSRTRIVMQRPPLLLVLVAESLDFAEYKILHPRMLDSERDFDEEHIGSCTEYSFQLIAPHRCVELVSGFVQG